MNLICVAAVPHLFRRNPVPHDLPVRHTLFRTLAGDVQPSVAVVRRRR